MLRRESLMDGIFRRPVPRKRSYRFAALTLCACLVTASALFAVSAFAHAGHGHGHDGAGGGCLACAQIAATQNLLWWLCSLARCAVFSLYAAFIPFWDQKTVSPRSYLRTLTALKIQMNR